MARTITTPEGRQLDLEYFAEWRRSLWLQPLAAAIQFLGDLSGRRVLEIGGRSGKVTSLFALLGAEVTMLQRGPVDRARSEVNKWKMQDRVRLYETDGGFGPVAGRQFDVIFTKSVLWCVKDLAGFLDEIDNHLAPGGKVAFLENNKGGKFVQWLRRNVIHRKNLSYESSYFGITSEQIDLFRRRFGDLTLRRRRYFVWEIFGHKR